MSGLGETLAAPSAIAGLISLGIEVAKALYSVADGIAAAGEEVRAVALEVSMYTQTMDAIRDVIERQERVATSIMALIDRLVSICLPIFHTYKDMQRCLVPLLENFRNSKRKLEQINIRFAWYFRTKTKVYGCRSALKRQFSLLTPILTALGIDQGGKSTQSNYYIQNVQVRVVLQNSVESVNALHSPHGNRLLRFYRTESAEQALLSANKYSDKEWPEESLRLEMTIEDGNETGDDTTTKAKSPPEALSSPSSVARYQSTPDKNDDETLSLGEAEDINRKVELALDHGSKSVSNDIVDEIILETYSVEKQFLRLITQILVGLGTGDRPPPDPMRPSPKQYPEGQEDQHRGANPTLTPVASYSYEHSVVITDLNQSSFRFPLEDVKSCEGLYRALVEIGFDPYGNRDKIDLEELELLIYGHGIHLKDLTGAIILPRLWSKLIKPEMTIQIQKMLSREPSQNGREKKKREGILSNFLPKFR